MKPRLFTLKRKHTGLDFEYLLLWYRTDSIPTLDDFESKYQDGFYRPFHRDDEIVELGEKTSA